MHPQNKPSTKPKQPSRLSLKKVKLSKKKLLVLILAGLLLVVSISQLERLSSKGTIFGYKVRTNNSLKAKSNKNASGSLVTRNDDNDGSHSEACKVLSAEEVEKAISSGFKRSSGFVADKESPDLISSCIYTITKPGGEYVTISLLVRDQKDEATASKVVDSIKTAKKSGDIAGLGDRAYFNESANQLTVASGKRVITLTVSTSHSELDIKATSIKLAKASL